MLRIILCLLAFAGPVSAQTTAAVPIPASRFTAADTTRAIHRLFARHRRTGGIVTAGAFGAAIVVAGVLAANEDTGSGTSSGSGGSSSGGGGFGILTSGAGLGPFGFRGFLIFTTIAALPIIGYGLEQNVVYSPQHEAHIIANYKATHRLPPKIRRKLRRQLLHARPAR